MRSKPASSSRLTLIGLTAALSFSLCGCHKTVLVYGPSTLPAALGPSADETAKAEAAKHQLPGIPFYNHYGVCTRETVWLEPQTTIAFTVIADNGRPLTRTMTLNNRAFHDPDPRDHNADSLLTALQQVAGKHNEEITEHDKSLCPSEVAKNWDAVRNAYHVTPITEPLSDGDIKSNEKDLILVEISNTAGIGTAVDYSRVYYLNAKSPLMGTGTVDAKLNTDGTLSEGSASVDDETLNDILTAAATAGSAGLTAWSTIKAAGITGAATVESANAGAANAHIAGKQPPLACEAKDGWPEVRNKVAYQLTITPGGFKHDHKKVTPLEQSHGQCEVSGVVTDGSYTITPVTSDDNKPDKNAIGVSGTITLPKPKDTTLPNQ